MNPIIKILGLCGKVIPVIYAILGLCLIIVVHEFGHFIFAKMFGIHTPTFSVGFGPTIAERKIGDTNFRLAAIPLGGYVEISGMVEPGQGDQEHAQASDDRSFATKPYWQKFLVIMGGIVFNMLFAYAAIITLLWVGTPQPEVTIKEVVAGSAAASAGINPGDVLTTIGQYNIVENPSDLGAALKHVQDTDGPLAITLRRDGELQTIKVAVPATAPQGSGKLGISLAFPPTGPTERLPFGKAVSEGISRVHEMTVQTFSSLWRLISQRTVKGAGGPLMIISASAEQAKHGLLLLFGLLALISINLAVINVLPIPILDGGQLVLITIESLLGLIGIKIAIATKNAIFIASWIFMLSLILLFTFNDIKRLLGF